MEKLSIGVLGCASIAKKAMLPAIKSLSTNFHLVAIASRTYEKAANFASAFNCEPIVGYEELVERDDIDCIYIPLPTGLHFEWISKSIKAGKHVLCEKSLVVTHEEALKIVDLAIANDVLVMENFMFTFHSQHQIVKQAINDGHIGEIRCFRSSFGFPPFSDKDNIRYQQKLGGGALLDAGAYTVKATTFMLGNTFEVSGASLVYDSNSMVDIFGGAFLKNDKGIFSEIAFGFDNYYQCSYEIWGSKGKIMAERAFTAHPGMKPRIIIEKQDEKVEYLVPADNHFVNILLEFHRRITSLNDFNSFYKELLTQSLLLTQIKNYGGSNY